MPYVAGSDCFTLAVCIDRVNVLEPPPPPPEEPEPQAVIEAAARTPTARIPTRRRDHDGRRPPLFVPAVIDSSSLRMWHAQRRIVCDDARRLGAATSSNRFDTEN
jgi:hypothetical protein